MNLRRVCIWLFLCAGLLPSQTHIRGELRGLKLDKSRNPYIIDEDIVVPEGEELVIKEGCHLLFEPFTGLRVMGHLLVEGSGENPVVFTSVNDEEYNPESEELANPFDWNGILVGRNSEGAYMKNFVLRFSVYGIKGQTQAIMIQNGRLLQNGQFNFTIHDKIQPVPDDIPFSYGIDDGRGESGGDDAAPPDTNSDRKDEIHPQKRVFRYVCLGVGIAGIASGAVSTFLAVETHKDLQNLEAEYDIDPVNFNEQEWKDADTKFKSYQAAAWITGTLGLLGATGFTLTFVF